ncbi:response regulator [Caulobacter sp. UNC279MFTsu5.1]|jgi:two-component system KDP operon response regulator KdpE|uniref:response regulator n=1 Tax=Caulobacter sp. UNC279MFTsu5.1 TaxID=1502775 RepID=UPI0008EDF8A4|nr:response regulator transcription factor [Caulobacter sp. UNC279MFTsu5.1]SFI60455.1 two-component system, OmpR family, KDP operon response regulator KdpE [Caulobacter sp. UNC279MFTsu5.1]
MQSSLGQILLVDDEPQLVRALTPALGAAGYEVSVADSGQAALAHLASEGCDGVILDLGLPDLDGKAVIARIREWSEVPIVVLSARDIEQEKIAALDLGADDFVNKPFAVGELLARLRAAMRGRERRFSARARFKAGDLEINFADRRVFLQGDEVRLTPREYDLLRALARYAGRVVTHRQLMAAVWGPTAQIDAQFVRVLVGQVRQKIEEEPAAPRILLTEAGLGYRLIAEDEA